MPKHIGSTLDYLLKETGDLEAVNLATSKNILVLKFQRAMKRKRMSRIKFMVALNINEPTLTKLLDPNQIGRINLETLLKASFTLGIKLLDETPIESKKPPRTRFQRILQND
jgi:hypothetical protein